MNRNLPSDGKSSQCLWQGEIKIMKQYWYQFNIDLICIFQVAVMQQKNDI
jgi:hypothetical protein